MNGLLRSSLFNFISFELICNAKYTQAIQFTLHLNIYNTFIEKVQPIPKEVDFVVLIRDLNLIYDLKRVLHNEF